MYRALTFAELSLKMSFLLQIITLSYFLFFLIESFFFFFFFYLLLYNFSKINRILLFFCLLFGLYSCHTPSTTKTPPANIVSEFRITSTQVGAIRKGMTIKELYAALPEDRIKKLKTRTELSNETADYYYIYGDSSRLLLIVNTERQNDERSRISRIIVKDKRFQTASGIGLASTVGTIRTAYPHSQFLPSVDEIILYVPEIDANFEINKRLLPPSLAIDSTGEIAPDSIPAQTKVTDLSIFWDYSIKNLADKTFWKDLTHRFTNWVITQVPSIIILTLIFIGLLRLLNYIVKKLNKAAKRRVHLNENIDDAEGNKRIETLSGIILGVGKIFLWTIFVLIMLSKFNINIGPILASAGIVGLAVGFGAQELVRDFISGFFILLEDQIRTGDVAIINGTTGTVEKIEMRTTTLRDASGVVHIFQNGKINSLSNMTKGWSAIVVDIGVAYKEDTDHVNEIMKQVGDELMKDAAWQSILMGVDLWGVDSFGDSSVILKVKLTTKSGQQWAASREFRRRIKKAFDAQHIEIPFPQVSLNTGSGTGAMPVKIES